MLVNFVRMADENLKKRGKPCKVEKNVLVSTILVYKDQVIESGKVVKLHSEVWNTLSTELGIAASTIQSYVLNNRYKLKDLLGVETDNVCEDREENLENYIENNENSDVSLNESGTNFEFNIGIKKSIFNQMITEQDYYIYLKGKRVKRRKKILLRETWAGEVAAEMYTAKKLTHAFHYKNHYLTVDASRGQMNGNANLFLYHNKNRMSMNNSF